MTSSVSRRRALAGVAGVGVGVPLLAACGDDRTAGADAASPTAGTTDAGSPTGSPSESMGGSAGASARPAAEGLVPASDVPVGGGVVLKDAEIVVTQPSAGQFRAFTAICSHQGCLVGSVSDGAIHCPCHDSVFSATDGAVEGGPATEPLAAIPVTVVDGQVRRS